MNAEFTQLKWVNDEKGRYYEAVLQRDLLGDLIVYQLWGGIATKRDGHKSYFCSSKEQAIQYLKKLCKRREQHGYTLKIKTIDFN